MTYSLTVASCSCRGQHTHEHGIGDYMLCMPVQLRAQMGRPGDINVALLNKMPQFLFACDAHAKLYSIVTLA